MRCTKLTHDQSFGLCANEVEHLNYDTSSSVIIPVTALYISSIDYASNLHSGKTQLESCPPLFVVLRTHSK